MRQSAAILIVLAGLSVGCEARDQHVPPPVAAAREFISAVRRGDCDTAWSHFSAGSQAYIAEKSREMVRSAPYYAERFAPRHLYCKPTSVHRFNSYHPPSARLLSQTGERAMVGIERHEPAGFLLPGFWATRTDIYLAELQMIAESGAWKVRIEDAARSSGH